MNTGSQVDAILEKARKEILDLLEKDESVTYEEFQSDECDVINWTDDEGCSSNIIMYQEYDDS